LAWIDYPLRSPSAKLGGEPLGFGVVVRMQSRCPGGIAAAQIVNGDGDVQDELAELRGPPRRLRGPRHEARMVVHRLQKRRLETFRHITHAVVAAREAA
jgi:hypothetical protein